jgi:hypothetical protein
MKLIQRLRDYRSRRAERPFRRMRRDAPVNEEAHRSINEAAGRAYIAHINMNKYP